MKTFRASMILPLFGLLASLAACSGQAPTEGTASTSSSIAVVSQGGAQGEQGTPNAPATPAVGDHGPGKGDHHGHMGHGPASLIFAALKEPINLTDAQRTTIEATVSSLKESWKANAPKPSTNDTHKTELAAAIRKNDIKVDSLALKPDFKPELMAAPDKDAVLVKALTTLHDTLTPEQRTQLVASVEKRMAEGPKGFGDHGPKGEPNGKNGTNGKDDKGDKPDHKFGGKMGGFGPMRMLEGLDLTKDQTDAIKAKLEANKPAPPTEAEREAMKAQHETMKKEMSARLQTFATDSFDAKAFLAPPSNANAMPKMGFGGPDHMLKDLAVIVPLLTPAQRETLATKIEKGPPAPSMKDDVNAK